MRILKMILLLVFFLQSCESKTYEPKGLKKLNREEKIARSKKTFPPNPDFLVKNNKGEIITQDSIAKIINIEEFTTDIYVDENNELKELIIRRANKEDLEIRKIVNANKKQTFEQNRGVYEISVNCNDLDIRLEKIMESDQEMRKPGNDINIIEDLKNISEVISILEKCPMEVEKLSIEGKYATWLLVQHAPSNYFLKKYFSFFEEWSNNGTLRQTSVAMMKDRILMYDEEPQIYGTQVKLNNETNKYELYELASPETVNKRRKEIGFMPIEEYLARWEIEFNVEQE